MAAEKRGVLEAETVQNRQFIPTYTFRINQRTVDVLEKYRAAAALQLSISHDGNAIAKKVGFIHEMC